MPDLFPWSQTKAMPGDLSAGKPPCLMTPLSRCSPFLWITALQTYSTQPAESTVSYL